MSERPKCFVGFQRIWYWIRYNFRRKRSAHTYRPHERSTQQGNFRSRSLTEPDIYCRIQACTSPKSPPRKRFLDSTPENVVKIKMALEKEMNVEDFSEPPTMIKVDWFDKKIDEKGAINNIIPTKNSNIV